MNSLQCSIHSPSMSESKAGECRTNPELCFLDVVGYLILCSRQGIVFREEQVEKIQIQRNHLKAEFYRKQINTDLLFRGAGYFTISMLFMDVQLSLELCFESSCPQQPRDLTVETNIYQLINY